MQTAYIYILADLSLNCVQRRYFGCFGQSAIQFVCFVALRPKSTAMVMAEQSVHQTTLFPGQA